MSLGVTKPGQTSMVLAIGLFLASVSSEAQESEPPLRQFTPGSWSAVSELPAGPFRDRLQKLPQPARDRALTWLGRMHFASEDVGSLRADAEGGIYYVCELPAEGASMQGDEIATAAAPVPVSPFPASLLFHSRPGSSNVLYLNFAGDTISGTLWNTEVGRSTIPAVVFSMDGDYSTYSDSEQAAIKRIWQRVLEDYAPFDIDVTTERPAVFDNRMANLLFTRSTDANGALNPSPTAGGVAYVDVFGLSTYPSRRPAWVYVDNLGYNEAHIAEAGSHEIGHNLGLSHDGRSGGTEYYGGHGSGETSWGPLMGTGYFRNVSQWCRGDYYLANNTQDDLVIIAGKIAYRPDDHGDTLGGASALVFTDGTNIVSTTPETDPANANPANKGVIEQTLDVDVFSFITGSGPVRLAVDPWVTPAGTRGNNLDVLLELRDGGGAVVATNNPAGQTSAVLQTNLPQGLYFLAVRNTGVGDPFSPASSGYTSYGSLGQYFVSGYVTEATPFVVPPVADLDVEDLTQPGAASLLFTVTYSDNVAVNVGSIDSADIRVKGPRGYDRLVQLVSVSPAGNGTPRVATYAASAPDHSAWSSADNGAYLVQMEALQVVDVEGAAVSSGTLGRFLVVIPSVLYAADMSSNPGWTFDSQWEYDTPAYGSSGPQAGFTGSHIIGYNLGGNYGNNINPPRYATTPVINCSGSTALTLRFQRWLRMRSSDTAMIEASINGVSWVTLWSTTQSVTDSAWQEQTYLLPPSFTGSSTVRVRWGLSSNQVFSELGWNLDDVVLLDGGVLETNPPGAVLAVANIVTNTSLPHSCTVTYTDATAVSVASLDSSDLWVSGPGGYSSAVSFMGVNPLTDTSPVEASYSIPAPGGQWGWEDNGTYQLILRAGEVEDVYLNGTAETVVGGFQVDITLPGMLGVSPVGVVTSTGVVGGPFVPTNFVYTLTNSGELPLNWVAGVNAQWLAAAPTSGAIAAGESAVLNVSLVPIANGYAEGNYVGTVFLQNTSGGSGSTSRQLELVVQPTPTFNVAVSISPVGWGTVEPSGGSFAMNASVELLATAAQYFQFVEWTGDVAGMANPLALLIQSNISLTAHFAEMLTTNHPTPLWWLASQGQTNDFETAVDVVGANGLPLWQSYVAGLDPTNPASQLRLGLKTVDPVVLGWQPVTGRLYTLGLATNEFQGFSAVPGAVDLPWPIDRFTNAVEDHPAGFYRLEVRKP